MEGRRSTSNVEMRQEIFNTRHVTSCFASGSLVGMVSSSPFSKTALVQIEQVALNSSVLAYDAALGTSGSGVVTSLHACTNKDVHHNVYSIKFQAHSTLQVDEIETTGDQPFYAFDRASRDCRYMKLSDLGLSTMLRCGKWTPVADLSTSDWIWTTDGSVVAILRLSLSLSTTKSFHSFEVEEFHTYAVGVFSLVVHNPTYVYRSATHDDMQNFNAGRGIFCKDLEKDLTVDEHIAATQDSQLISATTDPQIATWLYRKFNGAGILRIDVEQLQRGSMIDVSNHPFQVPMGMRT